MSQFQMTANAYPIPPCFHGPVGGEDEYDTTEPVIGQLLAEPD